jgi:hypothetical protein
MIALNVLLATGDTRPSYFRPNLPIRLHNADHTTPRHPLPGTKQVTGFTLLQTELIDTQKASFDTMIRRAF